VGVVGLVRGCGNRQCRIDAFSPRLRGDQHTLWSDATTTWTHEDVPDLVNGPDQILGHHPVVGGDVAAARDAATTFVGVAMKDVKGKGGDYNDHFFRHYYWNDEMGEGVDEIHDHLY